MNASPPQLLSTIWRGVVRQLAERGEEETINSKMSITRARELRKESTRPAQMLWQQLRNHRLNGLKFRRQHPIDDFIVDFYCAEKKLIIEVDGEVHLEKEMIEYDQDRTEILEGLGLKVIRFKNSEVLENIEMILERIKNEL
jgi:very-short-patch-repair endonuclease